MKKKKEFLRIRQDRKRKNGANARACVRIHKDGARRFSDKREENDQRPRKNPLTVYSPTLVLFSKHNRPCLVF